METNNKKLLELIDKHKLSHKKIASVLMLAVGTIHSYTCNFDGPRHRHFPDRNLKMLTRYLSAHSIVRDEHKNG